MKSPKELTTKAYLNNFHKFEKIPNWINEILDEKIILELIKKGVNSKDIPNQFLNENIYFEFVKKNILFVMKLPIQFFTEKILNEILKNIHSFSFLVGYIPNKFLNDETIFKFFNTENSCSLYFRNISADYYTKFYELTKNIYIIPRNYRNDYMLKTSIKTDKNLISQININLIDEEICYNVLSDFYILYYIRDEIAEKVVSVLKI
jgi:hypothetical protein